MDILREDESAPASYPDAPEGLSTAAAAIDATVVWKRIEQWTAYRWAERSVKYILQGSGDFDPRLKPAELDTAERWTGSQWETVTLAAAPLGVTLTGGSYRLTYTVGDTADPPESVMQAYTRLAEYWAETQAEGGASSITDGDYSVTRSANTVARAMQYSGAADLLRGYRL